MITVCGVKGAPGATTLAVLTAALWGSPAVLSEADPAGGELALRLAGPQGQALPATPSLAQLALDAMQGPGPQDAVWTNVLQTAAGVAVVCGIASAGAMATTVREYARPLAQLMSSADNVIVDAGRLQTDSPALPLLAASDVIVVVVPDRAEAFFLLPELLGGLVGLLPVAFGVRSKVCPVVVADPARGRTAAGELGEFLTSAASLCIRRCGWRTTRRRPGSCRREWRRCAGRCCCAPRARWWTRCVVSSGGCASSGRPAPAPPRKGSIRPGATWRRPVGIRRCTVPDVSSVASSVRVDHELAGRLRREVGARLAEQRTAFQAAGTALSGEDERALARDLILDAVRGYGAQQLAASVVVPAAVLDGLGRAVWSAMYEADRLQTILDDPDVENVNIVSAARTFIKYADGRKERGPDSAGSDEELVELLRLPDGSRLAAIGWGV